ncbi:MAG: hypothetical protein AAB676_05580 [Verrucomicrobiota bacterium]
MVNISAFSNLGQLLSHSHHYTPSINSTHLKRNQLSPSVGVVLQEPVSALLTLHPPHHTPSFRLVGDRKSDGLCTVLGDPVVVVLLGNAKVSSRPRQSTAGNCVLNGHVKIHSSGMLVSL